MDADPMTTTPTQSDREKHGSVLKEMVQLRINARKLLSYENPGYEVRMNNAANSLPDDMGWAP